MVVLLDDNEKAVLTEFGVPPMTEEASGPITLAILRGNARWSSPELLFKDNNEVSTGSDMWALGMVAVELFTRILPFPDVIADGAVILQIFNGERPLRPDGVDESLWFLIKQCWDDSPSRRISVARLEAKIGEILDGRRTLFTSAGDFLASSSAEVENNRRSTIGNHYTSVVFVSASIVHHYHIISNLLSDCAFAPTRFHTEH